MEIDPTKVYSMPLIMGPLFDQATRPARVYGRVETLAVTLETEPGPLRELVPACFRIPDEPTVSVVFGDYDNVDFMAGHGYRVAYVGVSARFEGETDAVDGLCILVVWENDTVPIFTGRELIGIPKLHADISPIRQIEGGRFRATTSVWGQEVMRLELGGLKEQNLVVRRAAQKRVNTVPWLGYKHIAAIDGPPDASYPMVVWNEASIDELWFAQSWAVEFGINDEGDLGAPARITEALSTIPLGRVVFASRMRGSALLQIDRSRRLT